MTIRRLMIVVLIFIMTMMIVFFWRSNVQASSTHLKAYPNRTVTIVVTFPPGGGTDLLARKLGHELERKWNIPVLVENRPGASGNIGARYVAENKPDGYTLLMVNSSFAVNPGVYQNLGFDPKADFEPIINVAWVPSVLVVGQNSPILNLEQALTPIEGNTNIAFASCGNGTPQHLAGEMLAERTQTNLLQIPYKGCGPAVADIMSGQVPMGIVTISSAMSLIKNEQLRPLAVSSPKRSPVLPNTPTVIETGVDDYELDQWHGLLAPAGISAEIVEILNTTLSDIMSAEKIQDDLKALGYTPTFSTADEFKQTVNADIDRFVLLSQRIGLKLN